MDLEFTEDQEELRSSVRSFLQKECSLAVVRAVVESGEPAEGLWKAMVSLDWPALAVPEENGGVGLSFVETAVLAEELGRAAAPGPLLATATQFVPIVRELGTPEQRQRFLSEVAVGNATGTLALADHPRRWGLGDVLTVARPAEGGWTLDGTKLGVLADAATTEIAVVAKMGDGLGVFVVPATDVELKPVQSLDRSRPLCSVVLNGVLVAADRALGEPGGEAIATGLRRALEEAAVAMALETVGTSDALFQMVLAYVKDRHQFGVPIGSFQAVKHKMSNMFVAIERARGLCYFAVAAIEEDSDGRALAVAMAKAASDDCQRLVCQDSYQSFGGIGYTWEHDGHLLIKRAKTTGELFGGSHLQSLLVAEQLGVVAAR
ncbi:MAG TPA: acyl-CoA dehydrogenase family protein [Acidimicrobiales bacterium]|nr:acyl-CoA dehydrogenase family protein [Acidimicrobiales bacterium]